MSVNQLGDGSPDGVIVCVAGSAAGFYGKAPAAQRAAINVQKASIVSAGSYISVASNTAAFAAEVAATLEGLGIWQ